MNTSRSIAAVITCAGLVMTAQASSSLTFITGGPGAPSAQNYGSALSSDGTKVVGMWGPSGGGPEGAYMWSQAGGFQDVPSLASGGYISPSGVSNNGVVVGGSTNSSGDTESFQWSVGGGTLAMGDLDGNFFYSEAAGVSDDGSVIVGTGTSWVSNEAFRWTQSTGMTGMGTLPGGGYQRSHANAVSGDGSVIAGYGFNSNDDFEAFRWTDSGGMVGIGIPMGFQGTRATGISPGGQYIIGSADHADGMGAFIWDEVGGMRALATPDGSTPYKIVFDVSDTGAVVGLVETVSSEVKAAMWDLAGQLIFLDDLIAGLPGTADWTPEAALGISADGNTILLVGHNAAGDYSSALLTIPTPGSAALMILGGLAAARRRR